MAREKFFNVYCRYYLENEDGKTIELPRGYTNVERLCYPRNLFFFEYNDKVGIIDSSGEEVLPPLYDQIYSEEDSNGEMFFFLMRGELKELRDASLQHILLGGKKYCEINLSLTKNNLVPVSPDFHGPKWHKNYRKDGWMIADIETGELLATEYFEVNFGDKDRYYIVSTEGKSGKFGVYDTKNRQENIPCEYNNFSFSQNYISANYGGFSDIYTNEGKLVLKEIPGRLGVYNKSVPDWFMSTINCGDHLENRFYNFVKLNKSTVAVIIYEEEGYAEPIQPDVRIFDSTNWNDKPHRKGYDALIAATIDKLERERYIFRSER